MLVLVGFFAATFGAACETGLSVGYSVAQYFGWQWGKFVEPLRAARFHTVVLLSCIAGVGILLTTVDPILVTEYSVVFSALALPLTYLPILVVANDRTYLGDHVNGRLANSLGTVYLVVVVVASLAAIPLMVVTGAAHDPRHRTRPGPIEAGTPLALGLRLLDHQILGREQEMVGNVDDVALEERDGRLVAVGPAPRAGRLGAPPARRARPVGPRPSGAGSTRGRTPARSCCPSTTCSPSGRRCTSTRGPSASSPAPTVSSCGCGGTWSPASPARGAASTPSAATSTPRLARTPTSTSSLGAHLLSSLLGAGW